MLPCIVLATDSLGKGDKPLTTLLSEHSPLFLQAAAMRHVVGIAESPLKEDNERFQRHVAGSDAAQPIFATFADVKKHFRGVCDWEGVTCDSDGVVRHIEWLAFRKPPVRLRYLFVRWVPNTVRNLLISTQNLAVKDKFQTRSLPREATSIHILQCNFEGEFAAEALPAGLLKINLTGNLLSGTVSLIKIPPFIEKMCLRWNPFDGVIFDNKALPASLVTVEFLSTKKMQKIEVNDRRGDKRVIVKHHNTSTLLEKTI